MIDKVEYDLDTSGGVMEEIQALIAPPQSDDSKKRQIGKDAMYSRSKRLLNRDSCDACKEGGDLLCCDQCPASFHLQCCDPPVEDEDVPTGEWICNECKYGITKKCDVKNVLPGSQPCSEKSDSSSRSSSPVDSELGMNPFEKLTAFYRNKNPREFQLPLNMQDFTVMPGDRKRRTTAQAKKKEEEAQRHCFVCAKSSRICTLINCDFCPLVFHCDCLTPPLAQEPIGLWMCPNHPENFEPNIRTPRYSVRAQVLEDLRSAISQNAIKIQFFNRAKKERILMNRLHHQPKKRRVSLVPDIVKAQYRNPPACVIPDIKQSGIIIEPHMKPLQFPTSQEKEEWLKAVIDMQCSIAANLEQTHLSNINEKLPADIPVSESGSSNSLENSFNSSWIANSEANTDTASEAENQNEITTDIKEIPDEGCGSSTDGVDLMPAEVLVESDNDVEMNPESNEADSYHETSKVEEEKVNNEEQSMEPDSTSSVSQSHSENENRASATSTSFLLCNESVESLNTEFEVDSPSDNVTSTRKISIDGEIAVSCISSASSELAVFASPDDVQGLTDSTNSLLSTKTTGSRSTPVVGAITADVAKDPTLSQLDERLVRVLAYQRLQQLGGKKGFLTPKLSKPGITEKLKCTITTETKKAIAVFTPLNKSGPACYMRYNTFNAGQGADMDLCLEHYGYCNFVSSKQSTIFYDEETRQFELLNYSEHGTIVDNVLYSCDFSEKQKSNYTSSHAKFDNNSKYLCLLEKKRKPPVGRTTKGLGVEYITRGCGCRASASSLIGGSGAGWEGTAVLHHGSYVKFGCLHFIFSIVECAPNAVDKSNQNLAPDKIANQSLNPVMAQSMHKPPET